MDFLAPFQTNFSIARVDALNKDQNMGWFVVQLGVVNGNEYNYSNAQVLFKRPFLFVSFELDDF